MERVALRKSDPLNVSFSKSQRLIVNDFGVYYKVRGGRLNGPFPSQSEAEQDLEVFKQVVAIEEMIDTENLRFFS